MGIKITQEGKNKIRELIYRKGKNNKEFAKEVIGCTPEHFSSIINNRFSPSPKLSSKILNELKKEFNEEIKWKDIYKLK